MSAGTVLGHPERGHGSRWRRCLHALVHSERAAWALQNAVGALFAALFCVVLDLQFTLACLCGVLYSASSLVLSLDRSIGGRLFGGIICIGTVLSGAGLGGGLVALAWVARGDGRALVQYLPPDLQAVPPLTTIQRWQDAFAQLTSVPLPPLLKELLDQIVADLSALLGELLPAVSPSYWGLLMALSALSLLPAAAARAQPDFGKGVIVAIFVVFLSSMLVFGSLMPVLGPTLFWDTVVFGYFKVALVAAAANAVAGLLLCVRSAHDDLRRGCAALMLACGTRISRLGTAASAAAAAPGAGAGRGGNDGDTEAEGAAAAAGSVQPEQPAVAEEKYRAEIEGYVRRRVDECCRLAGLPGLPGAEGGEGGAGVAWASREAGAAAAGLPPLPARASEAAVQLLHADLEVSLKTARLEPPLPQLCSQPGADVALFAALERQLARLQAAVAVLARGQAGALAALQGAAGGAAGAAAASLQGALARCAALAAAACGGAAEALARMPPLAPCSGPSLAWRPLPAASWQGARSELQAAGAQLAESYGQLYRREGLHFALSLSVTEHRALLYSLAASLELLAAAQAAEAAAAAALAVPAALAAPPAEGKLGGAEAAAAGEADSKDLEAAPGADDGTAASKAGEEGAAAGSPPAAPGPSALRGRLAALAANPYVASLAVLLVLASPLPAVKLVLEACWGVARSLPRLLSGRMSWRTAVRDPLVQFAAKYWLAMSGTVLVIIAIMWKAVPDGPGPLQDAFQQADFFVVWQPIYASITVAICLQDTVEGSVIRGVLRSTMTVLGGTLGYLVMLNGALANNPYWLLAWAAAGSGLGGLLAPDRSLRYSLFLAVFTFNAVVLCQYIGCCDVAGDPKVFAGKVVSTVIGSTVAILAGWLVLPQYGSSRMLRRQAGALHSTLRLLRDMHVEVAAAAAEARGMRAAGWLPAIEEEIQAPLALVAADLELNSLDRRQMPLTWHLLPEPAAVRLEQAALGALRDRLASAALLLGQDAFSGDPGGGRAVVPGPAFRALLQRLQPQIQQQMASLEALVQACCNNMAAGLAGGQLAPLRAAVAAACDAAAAERLRLHQAYLQAQPAVLQAAGGHCAGDFACQAWLHAVLRCTDEMMVAARLLLQDAAQDRDVLLGWLRAWRGQRHAPA